MTKRYKRKLSNYGFEISVRLCGYYVAVRLFPLGTWLRALCIVGDGKNSVHSGSWHLMLGPVHAHGYYLGWHLFEFGVDISYDPFWGDAVSAPPGTKKLFGRTSA